MTAILGSNITIMVRDMDTAISFYTGTLGFTLKNRYGNHWADIEAPEMNIGLHPAGKDVITGNNLSIGLRVADLKATVETFEAKGVHFEHREGGDPSLRHFMDPDGNMFYLVQPKW